MAANHYAFMRREIRKQVRREVEAELYARRRDRINLAKFYTLFAGAVIGCIGTGVLADIGFHAIFG